MIYLNSPFCSRKLWGTKVDNTGSASDTGADTTAQAQTNASPSRKTNACHNTESHTGISGSPSALPIDVHSDRENSGHVPHLICAFQTSLCIQKKFTIRNPSYLLFLCKQTRRKVCEWGVTVGHLTHRLTNLFPLWQIHCPHKLRLHHRIHVDCLPSHKPALDYRPLSSLPLSRFLSMIWNT